MDGKGWVNPSFHPLAMGPPSNFLRFATSPTARRAAEDSLPKRSSDESHAFVNHTKAHHVRDLAHAANRRSPSSSGSASSRALTSPKVSTPNLLGSQSSPALKGSWSGSSGGSPPRTRQSPPRAQALTFDPTRPKPVGPALAYTNYMALGTPRVKQWERERATALAPSPPPPQPSYYMTHESTSRCHPRARARSLGSRLSFLARGAVWPKGYHAPGVQHHLRPLRAPTAGASEGRSALEALEARETTIRNGLYAARGLENLFSAKPAELLPSPPQSRSQSQMASSVEVSK